MRLKAYQEDVIEDLTRFLALLMEEQNTARAYQSLWEEKNVMVGFGGMPFYHENIHGVPEVCLKVPTGGGKTFIAANAIKPIFSSMPVMRAKAVVWLVPSDAILTQTYQALTDPDHPYRQKLDVDFGGCVEVYSKTQLLTGHKFTPTTVTEQLSVFVLSYDSFRTSSKDGRKAFQENGSLAPFPKQMTDKSVLLPDTDETALIQVIRTLNPVVIVDESHHATSALSVEMLQNFNPCFILDLTATPKKGSNIISFVDAAQLKKANMVKLPVIVYNRKSQSDVYSDAISIRQKLELQAELEQKTSGIYIRPIVLFQAQPKNSADSTTYEKIKATLVEAGIPTEQIAIKTGDKDELKGKELKSPTCPIRYIITVNALKEGWDCPFAYVLATVANRTSSVDVEQILGRVLRLPEAQKNKNNVLNLSYVITSSNDFHATLEKVVKGLNNAGFTSKDYYAKDIDTENRPEEDKGFPESQLDFSMQPELEEDFPIVDTSELKQKIGTIMQTAHPESVEHDELFSAALVQNQKYEAELETAEETAVNLAPQEVRDKMNVFRMTDAFVQEAASLCFPQFMMETEPSLFSTNEFATLKLEYLNHGFSLKDKDVQIDFTTIDAEIALVDVDDAKDSTPKAWKLTGGESINFKEWFNAQPSNIKLANCKSLIKQKLSRMNCINDKELLEYIDRVIDTLSADQLTDLEQSYYPYMVKVESKVKELLAIHRTNTFNLWLEQGKIVCRPNYKLPSTISPTSYTSTMPNSLYTSEQEANGFEQRVAWELSSLSNIKWWHRNISRVGFQINGSTHAYPDIIAMTQNGKILMIEPKGDFLDNAKSKEKARIGATWASLAGSQYRYFMVYETRQPDYPGAYTFNRFMEIIKGVL